MNRRPSPFQGIVALSYLLVLFGPAVLLIIAVLRSNW